VLAVALLVAAAAVAVADWWAVQTGRRAVERLAKPATMLLLVGVAATWGDVAGDVRAWLVAAAILGVGGDIALLGTGDGAFMAGLSSFAAGHLAYVVAASLLGLELVWTVPGIIVIGALLGYRFVTRTVAGAGRTGGNALAGAVVFYAVVITAMVVTAWGTGLLLAGLGATLFAVSDWVLGHRRFAGPLPGGRLAIMVPYHVGQALLIVGLASG
jgi:uncharacterized membrane protein YhhN